jgi:glycosyltransferase involved in cell wall biosynthesis
LTITLLIRSLAYGGSERQLVALAKELHKRQHAVVVAVFYSGGSLEKELRKAGVTVRELNKQGRWDIIGFLLRFVRLLYEEKPDTLYGFFGTPNILTVLLKPIFPCIRMVWGVRGSYLDFARYDWLAGLHYKVERRLSRFADLIIVNSRAGLDHAIANGFPKNRMVVIPNGIDTERFRPDPGARQRVRAEWGVTESEKLVGLVGRLHPMKDHPTFLRAAARLLQEREGVRFVCVGDGPAGYQRELHVLGEKLGLVQRLIWAGARGDMPAVYNALDIATSSSYGEGFPNVVGEAMSCGVSCVVTDVGDSAWIVGETGVVVPPKNPEALAAGWEASLARDGSEMALKARLRVEENFSVGQMVEQTEKAIWSKV